MSRKTDSFDEKALEQLVKYFAKENQISADEFEDFREEVLDSVKEGYYAHWGDAITLEVEGTEYNVISSYDEAVRIARQVVEQDIQEDPNMFGDFLHGYMTITPTDRRIIAGEEADAYYEDMSESELVKEYEAAGYDLDLDEDDDEAEIDYDDIRETLASELADKIERELKDPVEYFVNERGIYDVEDLAKQPWIRIDSKEAAEDAVRTDGFEHFLSRYDGNYEETASGFIVFRE